MSLARGIRASHPHRHMRRKQDAASRFNHVRNRTIAGKGSWASSGNYRTRARGDSRPTKDIGIGNDVAVDAKDILKRDDKTDKVRSVIL